jgi:1-acyl-sn-glycerol-3-phosphate acyltransferase
LGAPFRYQVNGLENVRDSGPALFVANHLGALGPVEMVLSVPLRFYPWARAEMLDPRRAPAYLYDDLIRPVLHLEGRTGMILSWLITRLSVPLLTGIGTIPVDSASGWTAGTFRKSLALLEEGKNLLVFPEDAKREQDPQTLMSPFNCGFAGISRMYYKSTGKELPVYPVAVHADSKKVQIGDVLYYEDSGQWRTDTFRFCRLIEARVRELYLNLQTTGAR